MKATSLAVILFMAALSPAFCDDTHGPTADVSAGRALFLKNCAHCHGADAGGDEGPDLHKLDLSDDWIANRIKKGKAGQMTAFAGKLPQPEIDALVKYVQSLK